jgi:glycosyltransferase involved in cell wall biosynthesis
VTSSGTPTPSPGVSVIIPALNAERTLPGQLAALALQEDAPDFEVVVADNGSTDGTRSTARAWSDRLSIRVVDCSARPGASFARNAGAQAAAGDKLIFCDADDVVSSRWVQSMASALDRGRVLVAGPVVRVSEQTPVGWLPEDPGYGTDVAPYMGFLPCVLAGSMAVWRSDYLDLGGFDNSYRGGCEDVDFSWRAQLAGLEAVPAPGCYLYYVPRTAAAEVFAQERRYTSQGILLWVRFRAHPAVNGPSFRWTVTAVLRGLAELRPRMVKDRQARYAWAKRLGADLGSLEGHLTYRVLKRVPERQLLR